MEKLNWYKKGMTYEEFFAPLPHVNNIKLLSKSSGPNI